MVDKTIIGTTPDASDIFTLLGLEQVYAIGVEQVNYYIDNPKVGAAHVIHGFINRDKIMERIDQFLDKNESFFDGNKEEVRNFLTPTFLR